MTDTYNSGAIQVLRELEPVKKRPGMYTDVSCPNHLLQEVIDNCVDEAMSGHADRVNIVFHSNGSVSVEDNGRGMPVDLHPTEKKSGVEVIMETLHAGGKFDNKSYGFSGGLHGVGISVVNALSEKLTVDVKRQGKRYHIEYQHGIKQGPLCVIKGEKLAASDTGTRVTFMPAAQYFDSIHFQKGRLLELLKGKALLCPGVTIEVLEEESGHVTVFQFDDGIASFLKEQPLAEEAVSDWFFLGEHKQEEPAIEFSWGCFFSESKSQLNKPYVNLIPTPLGGTHLNAFRQGVHDALVEFGTLHNLLPKNIKMQPDDSFSHVNYVISLKMHDPVFAGQTKERLASRDCAGMISKSIKDALGIFLNANLDVANAVFKLALKNAQSRLRAAQKVERKELGKAMAIPGKLTDCDNDDRESTELFVVEGDSAGGSAKQARDRNTQAVMPLRGKILNSWEVSPDTLLKSEEINNIASAIGVDPNSDDLTGLRYGKICILADADSDGLHIASLFSILFIKHFPAVVEAGRLFVAMPPLYRIDIGKEVFYALDDKERDVILRKQEKKGKRNINVQRFKGLGEMNPDQLRDTTLDPVSRRLVQLTMPDPEGLEMVDRLFSKKRSEDRKLWITERSEQAARQKESATQSEPRPALQDNNDNQMELSYE